MHPCHAEEAFGQTNGGRLMDDVKFVDNMFEAVKAVAKTSHAADDSLLTAIQVLSEGTLKNDNMLLDLINTLIAEVNKLKEGEKARFELVAVLTKRLVAGSHDIKLLQQRVEALEVKILALNLKETVN
jgi:hypothetical protein